MLHFRDPDPIQLLELGLQPIFPSNPMPTPHISPMPTRSAAPMLSTRPEPMNLHTSASLENNYMGTLVNEEVTD